MSANRQGQRSVAALQRLVDLDAHLTGYAHDWAEGFAVTSAGSGEPGSGKGGHSDAVLAKVIASELGHNEGAGLADRCLALHEDIDALVRRISELDHEAARLVPLTPRVADLTARQQDPRFWGAGSCLVCDRWVPGVDDDRLRGGFCRAHYDAWRYALRTNPALAPPLDRGDWIRVMRAALASPEGGEHEHGRKGP